MKTIVMFLFCGLILSGCAVVKAIFKEEPETPPHKRYNPPSNYIQISPQEAYEAGYQDGYDDAKDYFYDMGYNLGYDEGKDDGYEKGHSAAEYEFGK